MALAVSPLSLGRLFRLLALGLLSAKLSLDTHWGHCCMLWQVIVSMVVHPLLFVAIFDVIHHSLSGNIGHDRTSPCQGVSRIPTGGS